jgi:hypothetical protein
MGEVKSDYRILMGKHVGSSRRWDNNINPLNAELNPICHLLALLGGATIVVVSRLRVKMVLSGIAKLGRK